MGKGFILAAAALVGACATGGSLRLTGWHLVPGSFDAGRGPDGNSIFLGAPEGLILVDTGRHPAHRDRLLAYAAQRGRPIVGVVNTHWHLDHSSGNRAIRAAHPRAELYATDAIEGARARFFPQSRAAAEAFLASGQATPERRAEIERDVATMSDPASLRPTRPVVRSGPIEIGGRRLQLNVARFAATEADIWIHDPPARLVIAGDLVVAPVPFMDTACPEGWQRALGEIASVPFETLIPGHGAPMSRPQFLEWRGAFDNLLSCAGSDAPRQQCIDGWLRDAAAFIPAGDERRIGAMVGYYLDSRLRGAPEERQSWCRS